MNGLPRESRANEERRRTVPVGKASADDAPSVSLQLDLMTSPQELLSCDSSGSHIPIQHGMERYTV